MLRTPSTTSLSLRLYRYSSVIALIVAVAAVSRVSAATPEDASKCPTSPATSFEESLVKRVVTLQSGRTYRLPEILCYRTPPTPGGSLVNYEALIGISPRLLGLKVDIAPGLVLPPGDQAPAWEGFKWQRANMFGTCAWKQFVDPGYDCVGGAAGALFDSATISIPVDYPDATFGFFANVRMERTVPSAGPNTFCPDTPGSPCYTWEHKGCAGPLAGPGCVAFSWPVGKPEFHVVIDPGHGRIRFNGVLEFHRHSVPGFDIIEDRLTLDLARLVRSGLNRLADQPTFSIKAVRLLRSGDRDPFMPADYACADAVCKENKRKASTRRRRVEAERILSEKQGVLVSLHTNCGAPRPGFSNDSSCPVEQVYQRTNGTQAFFGFPDERAILLARCLIDRLVAIGLRDRGVTQGTVTGGGASNIFSSKVPTVLLEVAYHSNIQLARDQTRLDAARLAGDRPALAEGITRGLLSYFERVVRGDTGGGC